MTSISKFPFPLSLAKKLKMRRTILVCGELVGRQRMSQSFSDSARTNNKRCASKALKGVKANESEKTLLLTASLTNTDEGGLRFGARTRSAVGWERRSPRRTLSRSAELPSPSLERSAPLLPLLQLASGSINSTTVAGIGFSTTSGALFLMLSTDLIEARFSSLRFNFSSAGFGTLAGGFGFGGGVDFPKECFLGEAIDEIGTPEFKAAVADAEAAAGGELRVPETFVLNWL